MILVRRTQFLSVETTTICLFCTYYPVGNRLKKQYFQNRVIYEPRGLLYKSDPIENP